MFGFPKTDDQPKPFSFGQEKSTDEKDEVKKPALTFSFTSEKKMMQKEPARLLHFHLVYTESNKNGPLFKPADKQESIAAPPSAEGQPAESKPVHGIIQ